jgi:hypothetical protein
MINYDMDTVFYLVRRYNEAGRRIRAVNAVGSWDAEELRENLVESPVFFLASIRHPATKTATHNIFLYLRESRRYGVHEPKSFKTFTRVRTAHDVANLVPLMPMAKEAIDGREGRLRIRI